jgi:hypothetical protein
MPDRHHVTTGSLTFGKGNRRPCNHSIGRIIRMSYKKVNCDSGLLQGKSTDAFDYTPGKRSKAPGRRFGVGRQDFGPSGSTESPLKVAVDRRGRPIPIGHEGSRSKLQNPLCPLSKREPAAGLAPAHRAAAAVFVYSGAAPCRLRIAALNRSCNNPPRRGQSRLFLHGYRFPLQCSARDESPHRENGLLPGRNLPEKQTIGPFRTFETKHARTGGLG